MMDEREGAVARATGRPGQVTAGGRVVKCEGFIIVPFTRGACSLGHTKKPSHSARPALHWLLTDHEHTMDTLLCCASFARRHWSRYFHMSARVCVCARLVLSADDDTLLFVCIIMV